MGILDNLENAWDEDFHFESNLIAEINNLGEAIKHDNQRDQ
jgi:hypothetical protein